MYSAPARPSSLNARTATAAMSRSSIGAVGQRDEASVRHHRSESVAPTSSERLRRTFPAAETSTWRPELSINISICSTIALSGLGCWSRG